MVVTSPLRVFLQKKTSYLQMFLEQKMYFLYDILYAFANGRSKPVLL